MKDYLLHIKKIFSPFVCYVALGSFSLLSLGTVSAFFILKIQQLSTLEDTIEELHRTALMSQYENAKTKTVLAQIQEADHFYLDKYIESLTFLEPEIKKLQVRMSNDQESEEKRKRLDFLQHQNQLLFAEEAIRYSEEIQEIEEKQQEPVEVNVEDLKKLLSLIEGVPILPYSPKEGRPHLFISDFQLTKKALSTKENVFVLNMHLLKREKKLKQ